MAGVGDRMDKRFKKVVSAAGIGAALLATVLVPRSAGAGTLYTPPSGTLVPGTLYA